MAIRKHGAAARPLRILFEMGTVGELTDGQLLERFATARGNAAELAFSVLVERHGGMVLRVCRSVLGHSTEADDAFQATFLVLVRRARGLWVRESLGPWLHQVAYRTAQCALRSARRRRRFEERWAAREREPTHGIDPETGQALHEEIERLPERFRAPLVLCDLEGRSHEQAARQLGWPVGTVKSRQARGRARLKDRLTRRGLAPERALALMLGLGRQEVLVSPALIDATVEAALRLGIVHGVAGGSAVSLMQGVLRTMWISQWIKVGAVVAASGSLTLGAGLLSRTGAAGAQTQAQGNDIQSQRDAEGLLAQEVKRGPLIVNFVQRGNLECSFTNDAYCMVEGKNTIINILPEGSHVKKGDIVCELDSAFLRDQLVNQVGSVREAETTYQNASLAREVAELAVNEYEQGILKADTASLKNDVDAASRAVRRAESRMKRIKQAQEQLAATPVAKEAKRAADVVAELDLIDRLEASEQQIEENKAALELAKSKQEQLEKYTSVKTIKSLRIELEQKRTEELALKKSWDIEKQKQAKLERQIPACKIPAPSTGMVVYANDPYRRVGAAVQIEAGATVRERQKIFSVPDFDKPMLAVVNVPEAQIDKVAPGMEAKVRVDSFFDLVLNGTVVMVSPLPNAQQGSRPPNEKVFTTHIRIDNGVKAGLRPGMSAQVDMIVGRRDNVLSVPVGAIVRYDGAAHIAIKKPDGGVEWRAVTLGLANEALVEVKEGISAGESVVLNPLSLMTEAEKALKLRGAVKGKRKRTQPAVAPVE